jgi:uncharacterized protein YbjT (DUF2867 family)
MITIIGGSGQIGAKVATLLLDRGKPVRLIARHAAKLASLVAKGAQAAVGDINDGAFLAAVIADSSALFVMNPPSFTSLDVIADQERTGHVLSETIGRSNVRKLVHISSIGADLASGTGPIVVLHREEQRLNSLAGKDVLHLRAGWFMENLLYRIGGIKHAGKMLYMVRPDVPMYVVATRDIAAIAADALAEPRFTGHSVRYLLGERTLTFAEMARIVGAAIGKPDLAYEQIPAARVKETLIAHGYSANGAEMFELTANAFNAGTLYRTVTRDETNTTSTSIEEFARTLFADAYRLS